MQGHLSDKPSLKVHEWLAILTIVGLIISVCIISKIQELRTEVHPYKPFQASKEGFDVLVKGAVAHPGVYHLHGPMLMKDIFLLAGVNEGADLRRYTPSAMVKKGRVINIPAKKMITVNLEGAVNGEKSIQVPKGSKVSDLLNVVDLAEDADIQVLQKKRALKDNETIVIPQG